MTRMHGTESHETVRTGTGGGCRFQAGRITQPARPDRCVPVAHDEAVVAFYTGGRLALEMGTTWEVREGDVVLIPAGTHHRALRAERTELWGVKVHPRCAAGSGRASLLAPLDRVREGAAPVVHIAPHRRAFLATLFEEIATAARHEDQALDAIQESLLTLILAEVDAAAPAPPVARRSYAIVSSALRHIERHCLGPLTVEDVAAAVGRTPAHLTTAIRRETGLTAGAWIVSGRMAEARRLLDASDERVDSIAARIGYADVTHFIRTFRREHGATPAAWRAARRAVATGARDGVRSAGRPRDPSRDRR